MLKAPLAGKVKMLVTRRLTVAKKAVDFLFSVYACVLLCTFTAFQDIVMNRNLFSAEV